MSVIFSTPEFLPLRDGQFANFADNSKSFRQILMKSFGGVACLTSK